MSTIHCPITIPSDTAVLEADGKSALRDLAEALEEGKQVAYNDPWPGAVRLFRNLKNHLLQSAQHRGHQARLNAKGQVRRMASQFLIPVDNGEISLAKAPQIGWLDRFYSGSFYLPVNDLLGLNGSWQWYKNGMEYPVLNETLHPFYGVYFPTRYAHLFLLDDWLQEQNPKSAMDIGCGCGVLTSLLVKHGCKSILATDIVPNAIVGMNEEIERQKYSAEITAVEADIFPEEADPVDCIIFNPPWLPGNIHCITDHGSYYDEPVLGSFFQRADKYLRPDGQIVILYSSLAQDLGLTEENQVEKALAANPDWMVHEKLTSREHPPTPKTTRKWTKKTRPVEEVQHWVLKRA